MDTQVLETARPDVERSVEAVSTADRGLGQATSIFVSQRPRLFKIAHRILGSVVEAEDVVQEVWLRWQRTDRTVVLDPPAFLATTATRLAFNVAQSARRRHEVYVGPWLPEPMDGDVGPEIHTERREAAEMAILLLMEKLTPTQRAAYLLHEGFAYPYRQISEVLHLGVANTRQIVRRAHQRISSDRQAPVDSARRRCLVHAFLAAARAGNLAGLEALLATEIADRASGVHAREGVS